MDPAQLPPSPSRHATPALVLGILSIMLSGCFPVGLVLGFIGIARARAGSRELQLNPALEGPGLLEGGRICSIIGTVLSSIQAAFWMLYILMVLIIGLLSIIARSSGS